MPQVARALYAWLQVDDGPRHGRTGDVPAILVGAICPLPGVGLRMPGNKYAMKLVVTLIGPPSAGWIGEDVDPWIWPRWHRCWCHCSRGRGRRRRAADRWVSRRRGGLHRTPCGRGLYHRRTNNRFPESEGM